jgi:tripartite-type tricarboxylate transporter receptor subunit TctC
MRNLFLQVLGASALTVLLAASAMAQHAYPNKTVRVIVPYPPGGSVDPLARLVVQKLSDSMGQQFVVDNRAGGNTIIGSDALAKSKPDGYTLMVASSTFVLSALLFPTPFDIAKDFAPVASLAGTEVLLLLHPEVPANDMRGLIALAKAKPGQLNYATNYGSTIHLAGELLKIMAGIDMQIVNYKGGGPAFTDLMSGQVQLSIQPIISSVSLVNSGKLKAIAVSGEARFPGLPQVPTFTEAGLPGFDVKSWFGLFAPAGTPKEIVGTLSAEIERNLARPDFREKLQSLGMDPLSSTPEQFSALMKADTARFAKIIKTANIKVEN